MKNKKFNKKLALNKNTLVNLNGDAMTGIKGGNLWESYEEQTACCDETRGCSEMYCDSFPAGCDTAIECNTYGCTIFGC